MVGLKRQKKIEGWAQEITDPEQGLRPKTIWQKLADNDKLWLGMIVAIVVFAFAIAKIANAPGASEDKGSGIEAFGLGDYNDTAHNDFASGILTSKTLKLEILDARFLSATKFRVTVPSSMRADDVEYVCRYSARKIAHLFKAHATVYCYTKTVQGREILTARAGWVTDRGIVVKFLDKD